jgi:hypothetical protein
MPRAGGPAARAYGAETRFFLQADRFGRAGRVYAPSPTSRAGAPLELVSKDMERDYFMTSEERASTGSSTG